jgi:hypothetical protein
VARTQKENGNVLRSAITGEIGRARELDRPFVVREAADERQRAERVLHAGHDPCRLGIGGLGDQQHLQPIAGARRHVAIVGRDFGEELRL